MHSTTHAVPTCNLPLFKKKIADVARRARRNRLPVPVVFYGEEREVEMAQQAIVDGEHGRELASRKVRVTVRDVTVTGETMRVAGWTPVATLTHERAGEPIIYTWPGETCPVEYHAADNTCDHCGYRRSRKRTFIIRNDEGEHRNIGSSCVRDYCGIDPAEILKRQTILDLIDTTFDEFREQRDSTGAVPLCAAAYLAVVCMVSREYGWKSSKAAREDGGDPTWAEADTYRHVHSKGHDWYNGGRKVEVTDADRARAAKALEAAQDFERAGNAYLHNLRAIARSGVLHSVRERALIASLPAYVDSAKERERRRAEERNGNPGHFGIVGERTQFEVKCVMQKTFAGNYGPSTFHRLVTREGHILTWWASGRVRINPDAGWTSIRGTIKAHTEFRGVPQTKLTRCALAA